MIFRKKMYDDEAEKAKLKGLQSRINSEKLIMERKKLEKKEKMLKRENSPFAKFGKTISKKINEKPSSRKPKKNPLDDFFK